MISDEQKEMFLTYISENYNKRAVLIYEKEIEGISICSIKLYELILETRKIVMYKNVVIIPALNPTEALVDYVESLIKGGMDKILLVNDGSNEKCKKIFDKLQKKIMFL